MSEMTAIFPALYFNGFSDFKIFSKKCLTGVLTLWYLISAEGVLTLRAEQRRTNQ